MNPMVQNLEKLLASGKDGALLRYTLGKAYADDEQMAVARTHLQQATLQAFVAELGAVPHRMEIAQAAGALIAALDRRQQEERGHLAEAFARFTNDRMRRRFAALSQDGKEP